MTQHPSGFQCKLKDIFLLTVRFLQTQPAASATDSVSPLQIVLHTATVTKLTLQHGLGPRQPQAAPPLLLPISAEISELLSDLILLIVPLLSFISMEKGLRKLFRNQTKLVFSDLFGTCGRYLQKQYIAGKD